MDLHAWATQLLYGDSLACKLEIPATLVDGAPGAVGSVPDFPGRPAVLRPREGRAVFPGEREVEGEAARGRLLHFFANHELLAIELFALALLRFPAAPRAFRRGLVGIIV